MQLENFAYLGNPIEETSTVDMTRTVLDGNGNTVATLKAEAYASVAKIDYSEVLRTLIGKGRTALATGASYTDKDFALQVNASIAGTNYIFVRGVSQIAGRAATDFKFLTEMPELRHYVGYPLSISYIINNSTRYYWALQINDEFFENNIALSNLASIFKAHVTSRLDINPNTETHTTGISVHGYNCSYIGYFPDENSSYPYKWQQSGNVNIFWTAMRDPQANSPAQNGSTTYLISSVTTETKNKPMDGRLVLLNNGSTRDRIKVREMPIPAHPFYVRWINNLGGWEYFMFACQQKEANQLSANDTYEPYITAGRYGQRKAFHKEATRVVETSTGIIDRQTYESVSKLIYSPVIQLYDAVESDWIEIQVRDGKNEVLAEQPTGELIMTFELPTPQLNK